MSQKEKVLLHLLEYKKITSWEAIKKYRATRLSAIIFDLKDDGHLINSKVIRQTPVKWWVEYQYKGFKKLSIK